MVVYHGHLFSGERRFGFESTFFRLAQRPGAKVTLENFDDSQVYMAHMALSDLETKTFHHEERFNREGWNAHAKVEDLDLRNGNWTLLRQKDGTLKLEGSIQSKIAFSLNLSPQKQHVIFGENGISIKGRDKRAASYYITWPRLKTTGTLRCDGKSFPVTGSAWMDHEISSSQLDENQEGWDWLSVQFDDGREIMLYMLRLKEGGYSEFSQLVWIDKDGRLTHQKPDQFSWQPGGEWKSKETGSQLPHTTAIYHFGSSIGKKANLPGRSFDG